MDSGLAAARRPGMTKRVNFSEIALYWPLALTKVASPFASFQAPVHCCFGTAIKCVLVIPSCLRITPPAKKAR